MSIENSLERIADALEVLSGKAEADSVETSTTDAPETPKKPAAKKKVTKKAASKKKTTRKAAPKDDDDAPDKPDVRKALRRLQAATSPDKVKALLKKAGATGVGNLEIGKYQKVIDAANKAADAAE